MSEQAALFGVTVPPGLKLGDRQWAALDALKEGPLSSADLGTRIHLSPRTRICDYCLNEMECWWAESDGASVGSSLRKHGLTKFSRKLGVWYLVETGLPPLPAPSGQRIPF